MTGAADDQQAVVVDDGGRFVESGGVSTGLRVTRSTTGSTEAGMLSHKILFELLPEDQAGPDDSKDTAHRKINRERKVGNTLAVAATMFMSVLLVTVMIASYQTRSGQVPEGIYQQKGAIQRDRVEVPATDREKQQNSGQEVRPVPGTAALSSKEAAGNEESIMGPLGPEGDKPRASLEKKLPDQEGREAELRALGDLETTW